MQPKYATLVPLSRFIPNLADGDDVTAGLQEAVDSETHTTVFGDTGGPTIYIPPGRYFISDTVQITSACAIVGGGQRGTGLKLANGANCDMFEVSDSVAQFELRNLTLDGNRDNNASGRGIYFADAVEYRGAGRLVDLSVRRFAGHGIHAGIFRSSGYLYNVISGGNGGDGVRIQGYDWLIANANVGTNLGYGITTMNGGNHQVVNSTCYGNKTNIYIKDADRSIWVNQVAEGSTEDNILIDTTVQSATHSINGSFGAPVGTVTGTYSHFKILHARALTISGHVYDATGSVSPILPKYVINNDGDVNCRIDVGGLQWTVETYTDAFASASVQRITGIVGRIVLTPGDLSAVSGSPTIAAIASLWPVWSMPTNANSSVAVNLGHLSRKWKTFDVYVRGVNIGSGSGQVALRVVRSQRANAEDLSAGSTTGSVQLVTAAAQSVRQDTLIASQVTVDSSKEQLIRIDRRGVTGADGDTLAGAWGIEAIEIRWRA